ncbi:hypothetical protein PS639_02001 [Pseudomonas fluorescens]|nr:hypothetical protein PS639_02001 [Pseudomonas fluorescens]
MTPNRYARCSSSSPGSAKKAFSVTPSTSASRNRVPTLGVLVPVSKRLMVLGSKPVFSPSSFSCVRRVPGSGSQGHAPDRRASASGAGDAGSQACSGGIRLAERAKRISAKSQLWGFPSTIESPTDDGLPGSPPTWSRIMSLISPVIFIRSKARRMRCTGALGSLRT